MSFSHSPKIVTNGLVLALDAADQNSYPGSGTTWNDMSGNGNTGTLTNTPTYSSTNSGTFTFDGSTQYVSLPSSLTRLNTNYSISMWINPSTISVSPYLTSDWNGPGRNYLFYQVNNKIQLLIGNGTTSQDAAQQSNLSLVANTWYNTAFVVIGTTHIIYINGILDNSTIGSYSGGITSNARNIATSVSPIASDCFNGKISSTLMYNRSLSSTEILQNYNALKPRFGL